MPKTLEVRVKVEKYYNCNMLEYYLTARILIALIFYLK